MSANSPASERDDALRALASGDVQILFSVDLFNEGIDVPAVDAVLMLRPTESATVFLQQLGRGLRRSHGKTYSRSSTSLATRRSRSASTFATAGCSAEPVEIEAMLPRTSPTSPPVAR
ncbi:MAG: hypothetical protein IPM45_00085 [Acidimicrobiales bacterium]|nr:hypothetical protein [Acidimicrobiales bacterium]